MTKRRLEGRRRGGHVNETQQFDGQTYGQLVRWPFEKLVKARQFGYDEKGRAAEAAWQRENAGRYYDTHEGGLECWALWPDVWSRRGCCSEGVIEFHPGSCDHSGRSSRMDWRREGGYQASAAVLLGSVGVAFMEIGPRSRETAYWRAGRDDLTAAGAHLVSTLDTVYGVEARLVTYLDT